MSASSSTTPCSIPRGPRATARTSSASPPGPVARWARGLPGRTRPRPPTRPRIDTQGKRFLLGGSLAELNSTATLDGKVPLKAGQPTSGTFYLNVDGWERTAKFQTDFKLLGPPVAITPIAKPSIAIEGPPSTFIRTDVPVRFKVLVDNPPADATVSVGLERKANQPEFSWSKPAAKDKRIGFAADPSGALVFDAKVQDWVADFRATKAVGRWQVVARLLKGGAHRSPCRRAWT